MHVGEEPSDEDVKAAHDWVHGICVMGYVPTRAQQLATIFDVAVKVAAPILEAMTWTVEETTDPLFVTCDRLPATWHTPSDEDAYQGVGIDQAEELWLPLNPRHLLVLRHRTAAEDRVRVDADRARFVNRHLARQCFRAVFHDPRLKVGPDDLPMRDRRIALRFSEGPFVGEGIPPGREVIHLWTPIRDDA